MRQPSESDIESAKEYLRQRLDAELSMTRNLEVVMNEAAEKIVKICYSAGVNPQSFHFSDLSAKAQKEINDVINWLQETIDDYFLTLAIADHKETKDDVLNVILAENHGLTFDERLTDYCEKYKNELLLLIGAGLFLGITESALLRSLKENLRHPYANQLLAEGIDAPITYGRGRTNSMFTAISDLTRFGIATGWMKNQYLQNLNNGCLGWYVRRGSSYPCDLCDSNVGFHVDEDSLPPYHGNCCCYAVPIYLE